MSSTIATVASTTGAMGSERQVIYAVNSARWWAFAYTGTNVLASYYSSDGTTWNVGATFTLANAHGSEGRNLAVQYLHVSTVDVVEALIVFAPTGLQLQTQALRGTISGTTLTWHTSATNVGTAAGDAASLLWTGSGIDYDSSNRAVIANGWLDNPIAGDTGATRGSADPGTAEQATPPTWAMPTVVDAGMANETRSNYVTRRGTANMGLVADNGSGTTSTTGLDFYTWNGTAWSGTSLNRSVTGAITAIDKNDWGCVTVGSTAHVVYRASTGTLTHRVYNGTSWGAGQSIPAQGNATGTGIALATDGTNVWCVLIANDAATSVRYIKWTAAGTAWDAAWTVLESSTVARTFVSCAELVSASSISVLWHQGTSLVSGLISIAGPTAPTWVGQYRRSLWNTRAWRVRAGSVPAPRGQANPANFAPGSAHRRRLPPRRPTPAPLVFPPPAQPPIPVMPASTPRRRIATRPAPRWAPLAPSPVLPQGPVYIAPPQTRRPSVPYLLRRAQAPRVPVQARPPTIAEPRPYLSRPAFRRRRSAPLVLPLVPPPTMLVSSVRRSPVLPGRSRPAPMVFPFVAPPAPPVFLQTPPRVRTHVELAWRRPPGLVPTAATQPAPVPPTHCTPSVGPNWQWIDGYCCQQMAGSRIAVDGGHVAVTDRVVWVDGIGQAYDPARP